MAFLMFHMEDTKTGLVTVEQYYILWEIRENPGLSKKIDMMKDTVENA